MGTTVYSVSHQEGSYYVPTKREALAEAREIRTAGDLYVSVHKITVTTRLSKRALYCALLNNESFAEAQEEIPL